MTKTTDPAVRTLNVAVAGNPNAGKTTIFNNLTGARQRVGNYPGVTVEWKQGTCRRGGLDLELVDLPGTYSLTALSEEELVARDYLLTRSPDVVVDVVDASNLERNLFLTTELLEIGLPVVLVLNMTDMAQDRGLQIDAARLSERLGVPVVAAVGNKGLGMDDLVAAVAKAAGDVPNLPASVGVCVDGSPQPGEVSDAGPGGWFVEYGDDAERTMSEMARTLVDDKPRRWHKVKLLEQDHRVLEGLYTPGAREAVTGLAARFTADCAEDVDTYVARRRYEAIGELCAEVLRQPDRRTITRSDRIDHWVMHPILGVPLFLSMMYLVFTLTFSAGTPLMEVIDRGFVWLAATINGFWEPGADSPLRSLLVDGIIGGVGGVLVFLPNIVLLFLAIAVLEGTGYMARAAFVMDRFMSKVGLHGKSFIPLLIGFGCTIPAIMATRTLETRRDRLITMMVLPLMSCGARLPIYALLIPAFFSPTWQGPMLWIVYVTGIVLALVGAQLLRSTVFRGDTTPFLMELPPYRMPTATSLLVQMWTRAWLYVKKAGTLILGAAIILWFLTFYPKPDADYVPPQDFDRAPATEAVSAPSIPYGQITDPAQAQAAELSYSIAGRVGRLLEPIIAPLGFDWRIGTALIGAVAAKEVFVAQMGIVFAVSEADAESEALRDRLRARYTPLVGFCIMIFALIATPCIATFAVTRQESGSLGWAVAQTWGLTALAWIVTFAIFQVGQLLGFAGSVGAA
ncbi:MAG: ferrous iron transport protein B [bacterium]|nr:ferrous iron transport protein B [bacterium]